MSGVDPLTLFQDRNGARKKRNRDDDGVVDLDNNERRAKKLKKKMKKKRKKLEKKLKKRAKKKAKKERRKAKKLRKKLKNQKAAHSSSSSSLSSDSDDSSSDEEGDAVKEFNVETFQNVVKDILKNNIAMFPALQQVLGALDTGQGIVLDGIQNIEAKTMLERVFNVLPMVKHVNGEQSISRKLDVTLPPFLSKIYAEVQKENEEGLLGTRQTAVRSDISDAKDPRKNHRSNALPRTTPALYRDAIHGTNRDVNNTNAAVGSSSSDDDDDFGPQRVDSANLRIAHRGFTEDEILRTKQFAKGGAKVSTTNPSGSSKREEWMTKLPEGRNIFTQMLGSKGPRKFLATNVDRKLASNDAVNLWTATPEQRMKIQQEKANKKLLGYDTSSSNKNGVVSSGGVVGTINLSSTKNRNAAQPVFQNATKMSLLEQHRAKQKDSRREDPNNGGSHVAEDYASSWRERELLRGSVDKAHLKSVLKDAKTMHSRFAAGKM